MAELVKPRGKPPSNSARLAKARRATLANAVLAGALLLFSDTALADRPIGVEAGFTTSDRAHRWHGETSYDASTKFHAGPRFTPYFGVDVLFQSLQLVHTNQRGIRGTGMGLAMAGTVPLGQRFDVGARLGRMSWSDLRIRDEDYGASRGVTASGPYRSLAMRAWTRSRRVAARIEYEQYEFAGVSGSGVSLGLDFRFR